MTLRLDKALVRRGLCESRTKAQHLIEAGVVLVNENIIKQKKYQVKATDTITLTSNPFPYVSRAGLKLERAARQFKINFTEKIVLDIGASTGGFTDYSLRQGASRVYALDVGHDQLHPSLSKHPQVINMEGINIRDLTQIGLPEMVDIIVVDVSFISLQHVFPIIKEFSTNATEIIVLIKPQFESGGKYLKHGVVKDALDHHAILTRVESYAQKHGLCIKQATHSPYCGDAGNIEFLAHLRQMSVKECPQIEWQTVIKKAHLHLKKDQPAGVNLCY